MIRPISKIVVHCSLLPYGSHRHIVTTHNIRFKYNELYSGYHYLITNGYDNQKNFQKLIYYYPDDGRIIKDRPIELEGIHCKGHNHDSIGICLIGNHHFSSRQFKSLARLIGDLSLQYPIHSDNIFCHSDLDPEKKFFCPSFDPMWLEFVKQWPYEYEVD